MGRPRTAYSAGAPYGRGARALHGNGGGAAAAVHGAPRRAPAGAGRPRVVLRRRPGHRCLRAGYGRRRALVGVDPRPTTARPSRARHLARQLTRAGDAGRGRGGRARVGAAGRPGSHGRAGLPPVGPAMRETWRRALEHDHLRSAGFALDAVAVETIFVAGPLLLSLFVVRTPAAVPLLFTAALLVGGVGYSVTPVVRGQGRRGSPDRASGKRRSGRRPGAPWSLLAARPGAQGHDAAVAGWATDGVGPPTWRTAGMLPLLAVAAAMSIGFGHIDTSLAATANRVLGQPADLGWLFTAIRRWKCDRRASSTVCDDRRGTSIAACRDCSAASSSAWCRCRCCCASRSRPWALMCALLVAGLSIAPTLIIAQNVVDRVSHPHRVSEAQSWLSTASTTGAAAGTATAGLLVDHLGISWSFGGAVFAAAAACCAAALGQSSWTCGPEARPSTTMTHRHQPYGARVGGRTTRAAAGTGGAATRPRPQRRMFWLTWKTLSGS